jgi:hypothetical protein
MKSIIFWNISSYSPLSVNQRFGGIYRLQFQGRKKQAEQETSVKAGDDMFFRNVG